jgi:general secretion pathway protein I
MERRRGFTLLEVLVAVAILGLGLTAILSAQFSAVAGATHARNISVATGLARCKMSEIEEQLRVDGFQELDVEDSGPCCEGDTAPNMSCSWAITKPTLPDANAKLDLESELDLTALGALANGPEGGGQNPENPGQPPDLGQMAQQLAGGAGMEDLAAGGVGGVAQMVMGMVYPDIKTIMEASARRITLVLTWTEGSRSYDVQLVQWVTKPTAGDSVAEELQTLTGGAGTGTGTGAPLPPGAKAPTGGRQPSLGNPGMRGGMGP